MTERELRERISHMAEEIPPETHRAFLSAACERKGEIIVKRKISRGLAITLALVAVAAVAIATSITYNQEWWWQNRIAGGKEEYPEQYQAIMANLINNPEQSQSEDNLVAITIQDVSWASEADTLTISFKAVPKNPTLYELHGMWDLDPDGCYIGEGGSTTVTEAGDEDRAMHWLWRNDVDMEWPESDWYGHVPGYGPVTDMMDDKNKHLLLIDFGHEVELITGSPVMAGSMDEFRISTGEVIFVIECDLAWLHEEYDQEMMNMAKKHPAQKEHFEEQIALAQIGRSQVQSSEGIRCALKYSVVEYTEGMDDLALYTGGTHGTVEFVVKNGEDDEK